MERGQGEGQVPQGGSGSHESMRMPVLMGRPVQSVATAGASRAAAGVAAQAHR